MDLKILLLLLVGVAVTGLLLREPAPEPATVLPSASPLPRDRFSIQGVTFGVERARVEKAFGEGRERVKDGESSFRYALSSTQAQDAFAVGYSAGRVEWVFGPTVESEGQVMLQIGEPAERVVEVLGQPDAELEDPHWQGIPGWYTYGNMVIRCQYYTDAPGGYKLSSSANAQAVPRVSGILLVDDPAQHTAKAYQSDLKGGPRDPDSLYVFIKAVKPGLKVKPI